MKLQTFQVESILGHLQGGKYGFKIMVWTNTEKDYIMEGNFFFKVKEKHSIYKKSVCTGGEWKK